MESSREVPQKLKIEPHMIQEFYFWLFVQRKQKHELRKIPHTPNVHWSIIYNTQDMQTTLMSVAGWLDE